MYKILCNVVTKAQPYATSSFGELELELVEYMELKLGKRNETQHAQRTTVSAEKKMSYLIIRQS